MATYIIADTLFFDNEQREKMGFNDFASMNKAIIKNWNSTVKKEDDVIFMGKLIGDGGETTDIKNLFHDLNGTFTCISKDKNMRFTKEEWKDIGFRFFWNVPMFNEINDKEVCYQIRPIINVAPYFQEYSVVVVDSDNPIEGMVKEIFLSVDALKWNYYPIKTDDIIEIHDRMIEFEKMEIGEEKRTDIKEEGED